MSKFDAANHYYSGQGVVMLSVTDPTTGASLYFEPVGNCTDLKITVTTSVLEHKGSQDGQRAIDKRIQTETKAAASMTIDNFIAPNLARATRGDYVTVPAATGFAEANKVGYQGKVIPLKHAKISNLVITAGATPLIAYVDDLTPYDYKSNLDHGSFQINDSTVIGVSALGAVITAISVGAVTAVTVASHTAKVGEYVDFQGITGADAAFLNGKAFLVTAITATTVTVAAVTTGKTLTTGAGSKVVAQSTVALTATYDYAAQYVVNALTAPLTEIAVRFEGLNTAEANDPVVVELFKFSIDPLKELALISDTFGTFQIEGQLLKDDSQTSGSKYFKVTKLN